jgi:predicted nucleic acid-binding protein
LSHFTVVYDACVLYPAPLRDLLMHLAMLDLYRAKWSSMIHDEWIGSLLKNRPDLKAEQLQRTRELMDANVRDCLITGFEDMIPAIKLPDERDRHVLAAAIRAGADIIVTFNQRDFPAASVQSYGIETLHPDEFLKYQLDLAPNIVCTAAKRHRASLKKKPKQVQEYFETLEAQGLAQTVPELRKYSELI